MSAPTAPLPDAATTRSAGDTDRLYDSLGPLPPPAGRPILIVLSGLPGSGKSHLCRRLAELHSPLVVLETDALRTALVDTPPTHAPAENARLFRAVHRLLEQLLRAGHCVALDATNLIRRNRKRLYQIAERSRAAVLIIQLTAPEPLIRERLTRRAADAQAGRATGDNSTAGIDVYERMRDTAQPIKHDHLVIDSSMDITPALREITRRLQRHEHPSSRISVPAAVRGKASMGI